jgi:hypothetical protein
MALANKLSAKSPLFPVVIVAVIILVVVIVGLIGWKTVGGGTDSERVPIDINKVKEDFKKNGMGHN